MSLSTHRQDSLRTSTQPLGERKARGGGRLAEARQEMDSEEMRRSEIDRGFLLPTLQASTLALPGHQSSLAQTPKPTVGQIPLKMQVPASQTSGWF